MFNRLPFGCYEQPMYEGTEFSRFFVGLKESDHAPSQERKNVQTTTCPRTLSIKIQSTDHHVTVVFFLTVIGALEIHYKRAIDRHRYEYIYCGCTNECLSKCLLNSSFIDFAFILFDFISSILFLFVYLIFLLLFLLTVDASNIWFH